MKCAAVVFARLKGVAVALEVAGLAQGGRLGACVGARGAASTRGASSPGVAAACGGIGLIGAANGVPAGAPSGQGQKRGDRARKAKRSQVHVRVSTGRASFL